MTYSYLRDLIEEGGVPTPHHLQLLAIASAPFTSRRGSTHVSLENWEEKKKEEQEEEEEEEEDMMMQLKAQRDTKGVMVKAEKVVGEGGMVDEGVGEALIPEERDGGLKRNRIGSAKRQLVGIWY